MSGFLKYTFAKYDPAFPQKGKEISNQSKTAQNWRTTFLYTNEVKKGVKVRF